MQISKSTNFRLSSLPLPLLLLNSLHQAERRIQNANIIPFLFVHQSSDRLDILINNFSIAELEMDHGYEEIASSKQHCSFFGDFDQSIDSVMVDIGLNYFFNLYVLLSQLWY